MKETVCYLRQIIMTFHTFFIIYYICFRQLWVIFHSASKLKQQPLSKELRYELTMKRRPTTTIHLKPLAEEYAKLAKIKQEVFANENENAKKNK